MNAAREAAYWPRSGAQSHRPGNPRFPGPQPGGNPVAASGCRQDPGPGRGPGQATAAGLCARLSGALNLLRDTVHNYPAPRAAGAGLFSANHREFSLLPRRLPPSGDLSQLSPSQAELISAILKEALTNVARHSGATRVAVELEVRQRIVRLSIKDNGRAVKR